MTAPRQQRHDADGAIQWVAAQNPGQPQIGLDEQLVVQPVEAPGGEPPGSQETARCAVAYGLDYTARPQIQPGRQQDARHGDSAGSNFKTDPAFTTGMPGALRQYTGQRW